jgi:hypothetical protein
MALSSCLNSTHIVPEYDMQQISLATVRPLETPKLALSQNGYGKKLLLKIIIKNKISIFINKI